MAWTVFVKLIDEGYLDIIEYLVEDDEELLQLAKDFAKDPRFIDFTAHPAGDD